MVKSIKDKNGKASKKEKKRGRKMRTFKIRLRQSKEGLLFLKLQKSY